MEQVYTKANFDSDFNMAMDDVVIKGDGLKYNTTTNELEIDSAELSSYFRQDIRNYISGTDAGGDGSFSYNATTGVITYTGPSASEVRSHFSAGGDLSYDSSTGRFQFDVEQVYTKENFDSDFNLTLDSAVLEGFGLKYDNNTNTLSIDSSELQSYFRPDIRGYFSGQGDLTYDSATGVFSFDVEQVYTKANFDSDFNVAIDSATTSDLSEGTNLYYTTARADSAARSALIAVDAGGDGSFAYDSATGKFTYTGPSSTEVRAHLTANKGLSVSSGEFNIDSANVRGMFSGGTGVTYTSGSGVIAIGQPVGTTDSVTFAGMTVSGNLQVNGTTTTVNSTTLDVADKNITIAKGAVNAAAADGGGITVDGANATLTYAATGDKFVFNKPFEGSFLGSDSDFDARLATKTTTNLAEGNNLYYTAARADSAARSALIAVDGGGDGSFTYDSATGKFTYTGPSATEVRNHFTGGDGIAISSGDIRIDSS